MTDRCIRSSLLAFSVIAVCASKSAAQSLHCRLALSLALDVSTSVDAAEYQLQTQGLAQALSSEEVASAVFGAPMSTVALHIFEWSGRYNQATVLDWTIVKSPHHLRRIAAQISGLERSQSEFPTSLGYALGFGATALKNAPPCDRSTLDVSGDGRNNDGFGPQLALKNFDFSGVVVNALAIGGADDGIVSYFLEEVIHGPGAFVEYAPDHSHFARAIKRKLVREIGEQQFSELESTRDLSDTKRQDYSEFSGNLPSNVD